MKSAAFVLGLIFTTASLTAVQSPPDDKSPKKSLPSPAEATTKPAAGVVKFKHLQVDLQKRRITIDAEVCLRSGPLELLMCQWGSKEHESILHTKALPSHIHAGLLMLGLSPGQPAQWVAADNDANGRMLPPRGARLEISLRWHDEHGKTHLVNASEFITLGDKKKSPLPKEWIFVGSQVLPGGKYWADGEGDIISVSNFSSSVIDVPFASSNKDELREFIANTQAIPKPLITKKTAGGRIVESSTPAAVQVIITPLPGAEKSPYARASVRINAVGDFYFDGVKTPRDHLSNAAAKFVAHHAKGMVVIQADPYTRAADIAWARSELRFGGVFSIRHQWLSVNRPILPRTSDQVTQALSQWTRKFANARDYIHDPGDEADLTLAQIRSGIKALEVRKQLLTKYAAQLDIKRRAYVSKSRSPQLKNNSAPSSAEAPRQLPNAQIDK